MSEEENQFTKWVNETVAENYPDQSRWPEFVSHLCDKMDVRSLPKFGCLSELEWLRYRDRDKPVGDQAESWLDRYSSEADIWDELLDLSRRLTHYHVSLSADRARLAKVERLTITIQTSDDFVAYYEKTKKGGLEKIAALMAKHPVEVVFVGGLENVGEYKYELNQADLQTLNFPEWLEGRWKDCGLYESCPEYLQKAEATGDPKDLPMTAWPEWIEYRKENDAEDRNRRRKDPNLNAEVWEDHVHRMMKYRRSRWKGEMYFIGERGGVYRISGAGRREYL